MADKGGFGKLSGKNQIPMVRIGGNLYQSVGEIIDEEHIDVYMPFGDSEEWVRFETAGTDGSHDGSC